MNWHSFQRNHVRHPDLKVLVFTPWAFRPCVLVTTGSCCCHRRLWLFFWIVHDTFDQTSMLTKPPHICCVYVCIYIYTHIIRTYIYIYILCNYICMHVLKHLGVNVLVHSCLHHEVWVYQGMYYCSHRLHSPQISTRNLHNWIDDD